jgi:ACS family D-galactonate transporter-like MFS transporter
VADRVPKPLTARTPAPDRPGTPSRARLLIVGMIFVAVVINYLDRSNISITVSDMKRAFGFNNEQMGLALSVTD